ncbi:hypothetical protein [Gottfriedia solisilvae]|uniref:hypothetical protein n=1 Tax=Gottfriedia solisilvae TaxID=1516104 RepID=UPI003D2ED7CF
MNRVELSNALLDGIREGQSKLEIINHIKFISSLLENFIDGQKVQNDFLERNFAFNDLSQAIEEISKKNYYYALTHLDDFLLKGKSYYLAVSNYEIFTVKSILDAIILLEEN